MGASDDEEEYVVYGSHLQAEQESVKGQYAKDVQDKAITKALPVWQQEVTDDQGRRRLHGAFTGGYSAGFFNTVGSKEGWAPSEFKSSRGQRADRKQFTVDDFMDEDELQEKGRKVVETSSGYDTFGHAATQQARAAALKEQAPRPGLPTVDLTDLIAPVPDSVGIRLLQKMGWRQGKGVGKARSSMATQGGSRWGTMASLGAENVAIHELPSKDDTHGLGYDPFKGADDFRAAKRQREGGEPGKQPAAKRGRGVAFGTGIMDEDDVYGLADDYVVEAESRDAYHFDLASDEEDDNNEHRAGRLDAARLLPGRQEPLPLLSKEETERRRYDLLPGFVKAQNPERLRQFPPPKVPPDFDPHHKFPPDHSASEGVGKEPPVPDADVLRAIKSLAPFVARMGPAFEALAMQKHSGHPAFRFLYGGEGAEYYRWQIRALRAAAKDTTGLAIGQRTAPLTVGDKGMLLGEEGAGLAGSGPAGASHPVQIADGDKQTLREDLDSTFARGNNQDMGIQGGAKPESYGLRPGRPAATPNTVAQRILDASAGRFASGGTFEQPEAAVGGLSVRKSAKPAEDAAKPQEPRAPRRTVVEWRPSTLLCRRFNVPDPFRGKPTPLDNGHPRSRTDALSLPQTAAAATAAAALPLSHLAPGQALPSKEQKTEGLLQLPPPPPRQEGANSGSTQPSRHSVHGTSKPAEGSAGDMAQDFLESMFVSAPAPGELPAPPPVAEKPIDLFKAIFEDGSDSSDEEEGSQQEVKEPPQVQESKPAVSVSGQAFLAAPNAGMATQTAAENAEPPLPARVVFKAREKATAAVEKPPPEEVIIDITRQEQLRQPPAVSNAEEIRDALALLRRAEKKGKRKKDKEKDKKKSSKSLKKSEKAKKHRGDAKTTKGSRDIASESSG